MRDQYLEKTVAYGAEELCIGSIWIIRAEDKSLCDLMKIQEFSCDKNGKLFIKTYGFTILFRGNGSIEKVFNCAMQSYPLEDFSRNYTLLCYTYDNGDKYTQDFWNLKPDLKKQVRDFREGSNGNR